MKDNDGVKEDTEMYSLDEVRKVDPEIADAIVARKGDRTVILS